MKFTKIEYIRNEFPGSPDTLVIDAGGSVSFESHSNEAAPDVSEIGTYRMTLPAEKIGALEQLLGSPPFATLPDHWGRLRPGEDARRVRVVAGARTSEKLVGYREPVDSAMQRVVDALDKLVLDVRSHPRRTLRIVLDRLVVGPDGLLALRLSLSNGGVEAIECRSPVSMLGESDAELSFQAWPDRPRSELSPSDLILLRPTAVEDPGFPAGAGSPPASFAVRPGEASSFNVILPWGARSPGRYRVRAVYMNPVTEVSGQPVYAGELYSATAVVTAP